MRRVGGYAVKLGWYRGYESAEWLSSVPVIVCWGGFSFGIQPRDLQEGTTMYKKVSTNMNFVEREKNVEKFWNDKDIFRKSMENRKEGTWHLRLTGWILKVLAPLM